ncbi:MAG: FecR domain-containing protein [Anaerolineae bacterium]
MSRRLLLSGVILLMVASLAGLYLWWSNQQAQSSHSATIEVEGTALLQKGGSGPFIEIGSERTLVSVGDRVKTGADSKAIITFFEGTESELGPETDLTIQELAVVSEQSFTIVLQLWLGQTWHRVVGLIDPNSRHQIVTPSAVVAVRGTEYGVAVDEKLVTRVEVVEGLIAVTAQEVTVELKPGEQTEVEPGQPPEPPRPRESDQGKMLEQVEVDGNAEIFVRYFATGERVNLTNHPAQDIFPASWSPDGSQILFSSDRDGDFEIYIMDDNGSNVRQLTDNSTEDFAPFWSPDGQKIIFDSGDPGWEGPGQIYVMNSDGSNWVQLTNFEGGAFAPSWSPDGTRIAFEGHVEDNAEIHVMDSDGSNVLRLTYDPAFDWAPLWSYDGQQIVFHRVREDTNGDGRIDFGDRPEIYVINPDGTNEHRLSGRIDIFVQDVWPDWHGWLEQQ